jgi:hypothetical protein
MQSAKVPVEAGDDGEGSIEQSLQNLGPLR